MNDLAGIGVGGFRINAAKHMAADDIQDILGRVGGDALVFQEVIESPGEPIKGEEYFQNGLVTEFDYGKKLSQVSQSGRLADLRTFVETWDGMMPSDRAVAFIDNHDSQRGHGGAGHVVTHQDGQLYDLINAFMLARPCGYPKIMSSYGFDDGNSGAPTTGEETKRVHPAGGGLKCFGDDWKCEHRWRPISNVVAFRNHTLPAW
jgi:alpha-amylase